MSPERETNHSRRESPAISIVMGVYNGAAKLRLTAESILRQTFDDFEFIIVDDGSTDGTEEGLRELAANDPRVVVLRQENAGLTEALIAGCAAARGDLIARQDVGDRSLPSRLQCQHDYLLRHPEVVAVGAGGRRIGPAGEYLGEATRDLSPDAVTHAFLTQGIGISHMSAMFRKDAYIRCGGYRRAFRYAQDVDLWYRMSRLGSLAEIPDVLFEWETELGGISVASHDRQRRLASLARKSFDFTLRGLDDSAVLREAEETSWGELPSASIISPRDARANAEFFIGSQLYSLGDGRCRGYLKRAIAERPLKVRSWAKLVLSYLKMQRSSA
ncbi:glycosyltransferase family 2 protein [Rhodopirellula sp. JC639]|uniref:glycosyltransferase family 2 protein n=1 Tax=Stieleria mannarensis TaxID=2755585 RepID=UPI0016008916|nr:glycosyltransferase [Rhodopirellula sp. JC639]